MIAEPPENNNFKNPSDLHVSKSVDRYVHVSRLFVLSLPSKAAAAAQRCRLRQRWAQDAPNACCDTGRHLRWICGQKLGNPGLNGAL